MKKLYSAALVLGILLAGCNNQPKKVEVVETEEDSHIVQASDEQNIIGTYEGTLPCADCDGIRTTLTLNEDTTYDLKSLYLGKEDPAIEECGTYTLLGDSLIELTTPSSNRKTYYKTFNNELMLSDAEGTENTGELAKFYILKKSN